MCPYYLDGDLGKSLSAPPGDTRVIGYCAVFKVREEGRSADCRVGLSKLNSMRSPRHGQSPLVRPSRSGRHFLAADCTRGERRGARELRRRSSGNRCPFLKGLPRKEVIQPQLPLRLPCYDFTPVTSPPSSGLSPAVSHEYPSKCWQHATRVALVAGLNPTSHDTS